MRLLITAMLVISSMALAQTQANEEKNGFWWYETTPSEEELTEQESRELTPPASLQQLVESASRDDRVEGRGATRAAHPLDRRLQFL